MKSNLSKILAGAMLAVCALFTSSARAGDWSVSYNSGGYCQPQRVIYAPAEVVTYYQAQTVYTAARIVGTVPAYGYRNPYGCGYVSNPYINPAPRSVYSTFDQFRAPARNIASGGNRRR